MFLHLILQNFKNLHFVLHAHTTMFRKHNELRWFGSDSSSSLLSFLMSTTIMESHPLLLRRRVPEYCFLFHENCSLVFLSQFSTIFNLFISSSVWVNLDFYPVGKNNLLSVGLFAIAHWCVPASCQCTNQIILIHYFHADTSITWWYNSDILLIWLSGGQIFSHWHSVAIFVVRNQSICVDVGKSSTMGVWHSRCANTGVSGLTSGQSCVYISTSEDCLLVQTQHNNLISLIPFLAIQCSKISRHIFLILYKVHCVWAF